MHAGEKIEEDLNEFAPDADIHFKRLAVTPEQIEQWDLPIRPTKTSDSRAARFGSDVSVELDAIEPRRLRSLVEKAILKRTRLRSPMTSQMRSQMRRNETRSANPASRTNGWCAVMAGTMIVTMTVAVRAETTVQRDAPTVRFYDARGKLDAVMGPALSGQLMWLSSDR